LHVLTRRNVFLKFTRCRFNLAATEIVRSYLPCSVPTKPPHSYHNLCFSPRLPRAFSFFLARPVPRYCTFTHDPHSCMNSCEFDFSRLPIRDFLSRWENCFPRLDNAPPHGLCRPPFPFVSLLRIFSKSASPLTGPLDMVAPLLSDPPLALPWASVEKTPTILSWVVFSGAAPLAPTQPVSASAGLRTLTISSFYSSNGFFVPIIRFSVIWRPVCFWQLLIVCAFGTAPSPFLFLLGVGSSWSFCGPG